MNTKRMITIAKLYLMSLFGKNHKKADMLRKSGLFIEYGGGVLASKLDSVLSRACINW